MKKLLSVLIAFALVFSLSTSVFAAEKKPPVCQSTGDGTQKKPTVICTPDQLLKAVSDSQLHYYKLGADIDLSAYKMYENRWYPEADFGGNLNGNGFKILNLTASTGLIKSIKAEAKVMNLTMLNVFAASSALTSTMLTISNYGTIENVTASGFTGAMGSSGGLVLNNFGKITNCSTEGTVSAQTSGGLVLNNMQSGTITNSSSSSKVNGISAGGLVNSNAGTIQNSYATGTILSERYRDGKCGCVVEPKISGAFAAYNTETGTIKNAYATGNVYTRNMQSSNFIGTNKGQMKSSQGYGKVLDYSEYKQ